MLGFVVVNDRGSADIGDSFVFLVDCGVLGVDVSKVGAVVGVDVAVPCVVVDGDGGLLIYRDRCRTAIYNQIIGITRTNTIYISTPQMGIFIKKNVCTVFVRIHISRHFSLVIVTIQNQILLRPVTRMRPNRICFKRIPTKTNVVIVIFTPRIVNESCSFRNIKNTAYILCIKNITTISIYI